MPLTDLLNSIWLFFTTSSWAIPIALIVFIAQKFIVPQVLELREVVKRARYAVIYYGNVFPTSKEDLVLDSIFNKTSKELRVISARLRSSRDNIPMYNYIERTGLIIKWNDIETAAIGFMGWSNEIFSVEPRKSGRQEYRRKIAKALNMKSY